MSIQFNLARVFQDTTKGLADEVNHILDDLALKLRVEDNRTDFTFGTGWTAGTPAAGFYKAPGGLVHLKGFAEKVGPTLPETVLTLPVGFRPVGTMKFWVGSQEIEVQADGDVILNSDPSYASPPGANLTGVSFLGEL